MLMEINPRALIVLILVVCCVFYLGASTSTILVPVCGICTPCLFFYLYLTKWVLAKDEGPQEMSEVDYKCGQEEAAAGEVPLLLVPRALARYAPLLGTTTGKLSTTTGPSAGEVRAASRYNRERGACCCWGWPPATGQLCIAAGDDRW